MPQASGDVNGNGAAKPPVNGGYDVYVHFHGAPKVVLQGRAFKLKLQRSCLGPSIGAPCFKGETAL